MARVDTDTLLIQIAADTSKLQGELAKATKAMATHMAAQAREAKKLNDSLDNVAKTIKGTLIAALSGLSIGKLSQLGREAMKTAEELQQNSRWIGIGAEKLQAWEEAAREVGIENGKLTASLDKMRGNLADFAADPSSNGALILKQLGISIRDNITGQLRAVDQIIPELANKLRGLGPGDQLIVGKTLFGDKNDDVVRFLLQGEQGLKGIEERMRSAGKVWSTEFIDKAAELNRQIDGLETKIGKDLKQAVVDFAPAWKLALEAVVEVQLAVDRLLSSVRIGSFRLGPKVSATERLAELDRDIAAAERREKTARDRRPGTFGIGTSRGAEEAQKLRQDLARLRQERSQILDQVDSEAARRQLPASATEADAMLAGITPNAKGDRLRTGSGSSKDQFADRLRDMQSELRVLNAELTKGADAAALLKAQLDFSKSSDGLKPTRQQFEALTAGIEQIRQKRGDVALKELRTENEHLAKVVAAESAGRRDLVAVLEMEFELRKKLGDKYVEANKAQIEAIAKQRYALEKQRELAAASLQQVTGLVQIGTSAMGEAFDIFADRGENAMERLRDMARNTVKQIMQWFIQLAVLNPIQNWITGGQSNLPTISSVFGAISRIGVSAATGTAGIDPNIMRAGGGSVMAGDSYLVGEKGPEWFTPSRSGRINPNGAGGNTIYADMRGASVDAVMRLERFVRSINASLESRAVGAVYNARTRMGKFARAF